MNYLVIACCMTSFLLSACSISNNKKNKDEFSDIAIMPAGIVSPTTSGAVAPATVKYITGECEIISDTSPLPLKCNNVNIQLLDEKQNVIQQNRIDSNGKFSFMVEPKAKYYIKITDKKSLMPFLSSLVSSGEQLTIKLKTKK